MNQEPISNKNRLLRAGRIRSIEDLDHQLAIENRTKNTVLLLAGALLVVFLMLACFAGFALYMVTNG